jgi:hypothetical protein
MNAFEKGLAAITVSRYCIVLGDLRFVLSDLGHNALKDVLE